MSTDNPPMGYIRDQNGKNIASCYHWMRLWRMANYIENDYCEPLHSKLAGRRYDAYDRYVKSVGGELYSHQKTVLKDMRRQLNRIEKSLKRKCGNES